MEPDEEETAALNAYLQAEQAYRHAQDELARKARERADAMAALVELHGTQDRVATLLGVHQSTVSRTLRGRSTGTT